MWRKNSRVSELPGGEWWWKQVQNDEWMLYQARQGSVLWEFLTDFGKMPKWSFLRMSEVLCFLMAAAATRVLKVTENDEYICCFVVLNQGPWKCGMELVKKVYFWPIFKQVGDGCVYCTKMGFQQVSNVISEHIPMAKVITNGYFKRSKFHFTWN